MTDNSNIYANDLNWISGDIHETTKIIDEVKKDTPYTYIKKEKNSKNYVDMSRYRCPSCKNVESKSWKSLRGILYCGKCGYWIRKQMLSIEGRNNSYKMKRDSTGLYCYICDRSRYCLWKKKGPFLLCNTCSKNDDKIQRITRKYYNQKISLIDMKAEENLTDSLPQQTIIDLSKTTLPQITNTTHPQLTNTTHPQITNTMHPQITNTYATNYYDNQVLIQLDTYVSEYDIILPSHNMSFSDDITELEDSLFLPNSVDIFNYTYNIDDNIELNYYH